MIGFFPVPYPDELLYSVCARYGERAGYSNKKEAIKSLFGSKSFSAVVDFPNRLEHFLEQLPFSSFTTDDLINRNTLFTLYEPFLSAERTVAIRLLLKSDSENNIRTKLALNVSQINTPEWLRFCPSCVAEDRKTYGETYWHRLHQLGGVMVCAEHECFLQNGTVRLDRECAANFHAAEDSLDIAPLKKLNEDNPEHNLHLYLARNAGWLLNQSSLFFNEGEIRERYHNILLKKGYAYYNGRVRNSVLSEAFSNHFPDGVLEEFGCALMSSRGNWLIKMMEAKRSNVLNHPLRHLLLMNFLRITAEEFFNGFLEYLPFGRGPYPCLNKAAGHYCELIIEDCKIFDNYVRNKRGLPVAVFECKCGFIYQRVGPDISDNAVLSYSSVREYGPVWEEKLKSLWKNLSLSLSVIAGELGVSTLLVVRHAIRLNLPMNTTNTRTVEGYERHRNPNKTYHELLNRNRERWQEIFKNNHSLTRQELMDSANTLYLWLRRNDSEWLEDHLPLPDKPSRKGDILDWRKTDKKLSAKVEKVCLEILKSTEPLIRVSITEIIRQVGSRKWLEKRHLKLPLTFAVVDRYLESLESFMLRKIPVLEKQYLKVGFPISKTEFVTKGDLRNSTAKESSLIREAVTDAVHRINLSAAK